MNLVGHKQILNFFELVIKNNNISHTYCFVGPESVGKKSVAKKISANILNVEFDKLVYQPDFTVVEQEINEKTGKTKKNIDIDQIRNLKQVLSRRSFLGGYKIAIIDDADKMNISSANALLKTLEEPKEKTIIFLITTDEALLPQTIQSRTQMIYFQPVKNSEISDYLVSRDLSEAQAEEFSRESCGMPGKALAWSQDSELYASYKLEVGRFKRIFGLPLYEKMDSVEPLFGDKTDHIAAREKLYSVLDLWSILLRQYFFENENVDKKIFLQVSNKINEAKNLLNKNIHPKLLIEQVLLALP